MAGKIFINYRRDDVPGDARGIREALVSEFGKDAVFMDVDNLLAGQRFDKELEKALARCQVLIAVMGPRWMELLTARAQSGERDYVREEIAAALKRSITVVPVRVGREGQMVPLPRAAQLPEDIRDLLLHQKQDVAHERFGRDMVELVSAIRIVAQGYRKPVSRGWIAGGAGGAIAAAVGAAWYMGVVPLPGAPSSVPPAPVADKCERYWDKIKTQKSIDVLEAFMRQCGDTFHGSIVASDLQKLKAARESKATQAEGARSQKQAKIKADAEAATVPKPGDTIRDCPDCPEMVEVPAGSFMMGSPESEEGRQPDEGPQRKVTIPKPFAASRFEVTFAEWDACFSAGGCKTKAEGQGWGRGKRPVIDVTWSDSQEYVNWLSKRTGKSYRLLTESEWEYAARAGTPTPFSTGKTITTDQANFNGNGTYGGSAKGNYREKTIDVGSFRPNAFGLFDMHGNVWEWVEDCYPESNENAPVDGTSSGCSSRVLRGGSWGSTPDNLRSALRNRDGPAYRSSNIGFRVARTL